LTILRWSDESVALDQLRKTNEKSRCCSVFESLDAAMQALGGLAKHRTGFFEQGGWFSTNRDDRTGEVMETVLPFVKGRLPAEIRANRQAPPPLF